MDEVFTHDVFLSHSSADKVVVREIANRLREDGLRVWFDEWEILPAENIPAKIEEGLQHSRVLVLCMSAHVFGSEWARLEAGTLRFRDPLNKDRRFLPLRLDDAHVEGSLAKFIGINWFPEEQDRAYLKLLEACRPRVVQSDVIAEAAPKVSAEKAFQLDSRETWACAFSVDAQRALTGGLAGTVQVWDTKTGRCLRILKGHTGGLWSVVWSADQRRALSCGDDNTVRMWDVEGGHCLQVFEGHTQSVRALAWSTNQRRVLSGSEDSSIRIWDSETGSCLRVLEDHTNCVSTVAYGNDRHQVLSGSQDKTIRLWDSETGRCLRVLEGHTGTVNSVAWSSDHDRVLSGSNDGTVRLWDVRTGSCLRVLQGHIGHVYDAEWSPDQFHALSCGLDWTVRLWNLEMGICVRVLEGHKNPVAVAVWSDDGHRVHSADRYGGIRIWDLTELVTKARVQDAPPVVWSPSAHQVQYTNAKVLLVGESGAGKTGLSQVLAGREWMPSDSTVGAWATQWKLPASQSDGVEREIWLWDFGGQADQKLIHQLYMQDAAMAVFVFDGQKENLFESLGQWDRDLARASHMPFTKLLVAGRVDSGGLRVSRNQLREFAKERGFAGRLFETSAKLGTDCEDLKQAILSGIDWGDIPWRSSPVLFKRLKEEILRLKDEGRVLMRLNELRDSLQLRLAGQDIHFQEAELKAVVGLLAGPAVVWELAFGSWILLQPERINAYAQAVIQALRDDEYERGAIAEERVLHGDLPYQSSLQRLPAEEERFILLAMHQTLVDRGLCLREHTEKGPLLIFPSYYRRERKELSGHPAVLVSYRFSGFLDEIYATLVVRLHYTESFKQDQLWRYAADFKTLTGKQLGVKLTRRAEGSGELEVYFDPVIPLEEKIIFSRYVHEHLLQKATEVVRLRHYVCPYCNTPVGNQEVATRKLMEGRKDILCVNCDDPEKRIPLWDDLEELFASPEVLQRVRELQKQSNIVLDNESKERALVGEVISTVALAGQISREFSVSDHGIDMEIEFKNDAGEATGQKLYLQLKSGDSYLRQRQRRSEGSKVKVEVFTIKNERHARYWMAQAFPVFLVIRNSEGEIRWMEVRDWLKRFGRGQKPVKQIIFEGERFDVMSVRRWRETVLRGT